jgi:hypothetical protein
LFGLVVAGTATSCSKRIQKVTRDALRPSTTLKGTIARKERKLSYLLNTNLQKKTTKWENFVVSSKNFTTDIHLQHFSTLE